MVDPTGEIPAPLVPRGARFEGSIEGFGPTRIDGAVEGDAVVAESLWIGAEARVRARIEAREVVVEGDVEGEIRAPARIELRSTARVRATLHTGCFVLAEGAHFEGRCHTVQDGPAPEPSAAGGSKSPSGTP